MHETLEILLDKGMIFYMHNHYCNRMRPEFAKKII